MNRLTGTLALCSLLFLGGCIMAARKGIGTIIGPRGSMTVLVDNGSLKQGEAIGHVSVQNRVGSRVSSDEVRMLVVAVEEQLSMSGFYGGGGDNLVLDLQLNGYTDRPAKKELKIRAELKRNGQVIAAAEIKANLNGFGNHKEVSEAIGKAMVKFIEKIGAD
jgi:hypothetical protein